MAIRGQRRVLPAVVVLHLACDGREWRADFHDLRHDGLVFVSDILCESGPHACLHRDASRPGSAARSDPIPARQVQHQWPLVGVHGRGRRRRVDVARRLQLESRLESRLRPECVTDALPPDVRGHQCREVELANVELPLTTPPEPIGIALGASQQLWGEGLWKVPQPSHATHVKSLS